MSDLTDDYNAKSKQRSTTLIIVILMKSQLKMVKEMSSTPQKPINEVSYIISDQKFGDTFVTFEIETSLAKEKILVDHRGDNYFD